MIAYPRKRYLSLTSAAWRQMRRNWNLPASPLQLWLEYVPGALFAGLDHLQRISKERGHSLEYSNGAIVILGYWRSGTTLLHELLCCDPRYCFPSTYACMNPHHFLLTGAPVAKSGERSERRPMDEMEIRPDSPQEDEFALLSLGARSPYEALLVPMRLKDALILADPQELLPEEQQQWRRIFSGFLRRVSEQGGGRPVILKSPAHGYRVAALRELLPDARFIVIVREPYKSFESVVRMWRTMMDSYSVTAMCTEDSIRETVLLDRARFEQKLASGTLGLPGNRLAVVTYESLVANPVEVIERLYHRLDLGSFGEVKNLIVKEVEARKDYRARAVEPSDAWRNRILATWGYVFDRYTQACSSHV